MTNILRSHPKKIVLPTLPDFSSYTNQELQRIHSCTSAYKDKDGWFKTPDGRVILPTDFATHLVQQVHQSTHLGEKKMQDDLLRKTHLRVVGLKAKMAEALGWCLKCHLVNAKSMVIRTGHWERRTKTRPETNWEINFTEEEAGLYGHLLYKYLLYKYLLVFVDTFSGWAEVFPTKHGAVLKKL